MYYNTLAGYYNMYSKKSVLIQLKWKIKPFFSKFLYFFFFYQYIRQEKKISLKPINNI